MSDDIGQNLEKTAKDIGKSLSDAANSEQVKKAQEQAQQAAAQAAQKVDETLKDLQKNESVKQAEEQAKQAAQELGKGLKNLGGLLKKKADEVTKK
jgi:adenylate kinase